MLFFISIDKKIVINLLFYVLCSFIRCFAITLAYVSVLLLGTSYINFCKDLLKFI